MLITKRPWTVSLVATPGLRMWANANWSLSERVCSWDGSNLSGTQCCWNKKLFSKLNGLKLTPEQESLVDSSIWMDQWALGKTQPSQPFNILQRCLIASISAQRQANTVLLTNVDRMVDHKFNLHWVLATSHKPAFMPIYLNVINISDNSLSFLVISTYHPDSHLGELTLGILTQGVLRWGRNYLGTWFVPLRSD